jgi:hypothetical protein
MMLALVFALTVAAPPSARLSYEQKCLYCHSEEVSESRRFTEGQWRRLIEGKRKRAPLLISRSDVEVLTRYMVQTLKLGVAARTAKVVTPPVPERPVAVTQPELKPPPVLEPVVVEPELAPPPLPDVVVDPALEEQAQAIIRQRCSKCHTLGRVYGRLDTFERSMATLERMRLKTGSGITDDELKLLEDFLRTQF